MKLPKYLRFYELDGYTKAKNCCDINDCKAGLLILRNYRNDCFDFGYRKELPKSYYKRVYDLTQKLIKFEEKEKSKKVKK